MSVRTQVGSVAGLWRYPVKSLAGQMLQSTYVDEQGVAGDRRAAFFLTTPDMPRSGKTLRGKEQPRFHTAASAGIARKYAPALDLEVREDGPYFDKCPVSLVFDCWLAELQQLCGHPVEALRFRPNILVAAATRVPPEGALTGARLLVGNVVLQVIEPIVRCVTPSYDLETSESSTALLRALVHVRANLLGVYCRVEQSGAIATNDRVHVLEIES